MNKSISANKNEGWQKPFGWFFLGLVGLMVAIFHAGLNPALVEFSNDAPLGAYASDWIGVLAGYSGAWDDLNSIGANVGAIPLTVSSLLRLVLGALWYSKIFVPITLIFLGSSAWFFFRALKLTPLACALGAFATCLNSMFFGGSCWGVGAQEIAFGMDFLALALATGNTPEMPAILRATRLALAGICVGVNVMEGADIGALCSCFVAAFVFYKSVFTEDGALGKRIFAGIVRVGTIAVFAGFLAVQTVVYLVGTQISGVDGTAQDSETKAEHWDWATQWSLPKTETLGLFIPGVFGYKMDTPKDMIPAVKNTYAGGAYWGGMGRGPNVDRFLDKVFQPGDELKISISAPEHPPQSVPLTINADGNIDAPMLGKVKAAGRSGLQLKMAIDDAYATHKISGGLEMPSGYMRFSGGGNYCGILVFLLAFWAIAQALRKKDSLFSTPQKHLIWYWSGLLVLTLPLAWGRFAPMFYGALYQLPYFSTIRNPVKILFFFCWALIVLFAYGVHALNQRYLDGTAAKSADLPTQLKLWWQRVRGFDRQWTQVLFGVFAASIFGWFYFSNAKTDFINYLQRLGFGDPTTAQQIASFSINQVAWFVGLLLLAMILMIATLAGYFSGSRARLGAILISAFLLFDLVRANLPYVTHWNYKEKYEVGSLNPILEKLTDKPYEHRVVGLRSETLFENLYRIEWMQHHFPYYNIQCLDIIQMPRMAADLKAYLTALAPDGSPEGALHIAREWQLTNTRYLLGPAGYLNSINEQLDPAKKRFSIAKRFNVIPKPDADISELNQEMQHGVFRGEKFTALENENGEYALFEFSGALPRAKLYGNWQVSTNDSANLKVLAAADFDPAQTVLISTPKNNLPTSATNQNDPGTVSFTSYSPKHLAFTANATTAAVLLLNDKFDANWRVTVDGQSAELLRCNYIMRGVQLSPGNHTVQFDFSVPNGPLKITTLAFLVALILCVALWRLSKTRNVSQS